MAVQYLMHFGVCVRDLERSIRFYRDALGFTEAGRLEIEGEPTATMLGLPELELHAMYLDRDGFRIELLHFPTPGTVGPAEARPMNQPGLTHMALRVDDLDETIRAVEAHGGRVIESSRVHNPSFEANLVYVTDPDGTRLELLQVPKDPTR
jgi:catechol 2,3-dioxygenase-like lactoylglutathione lyase family enzyme